MGLTSKDSSDGSEGSEGKEGGTDRHAIYQFQDRPEIYEKNLMQDISSFHKQPIRTIEVFSF